MPPDDPATGQRLAIAGLDEADLTGRNGAGFSQLDREQQRVDAERTGRNDRHLRAALATFGNERAGVLKEVARYRLGDDSAPGQGLSIASLDGTDELSPPPGIDISQALDIAHH
jgi:hypothetical protein